MLIKEYRIPLPLTVEEYRVAQLYMIAKKSREESKGAGSGVEILINEPYSDGPGGSGQYTRKIYHIGSHLPGWFKALLPKSALTVEEEAWNAYPYTKTRYTCPFVEKFFLEIETKYYADAGTQDNVFQLSSADIRGRIVDLIDVVKDQLWGGDYNREEDPKYFCSQKTNRGPLAENWIELCSENGPAVMCAYKLCRVEFKYWGMQSKIEKFIHDVALRKTMLRAHRQAWAWQDEWVGLTMEDIRLLEKETQEALAKKMARDENPTDNDDKAPHETAMRNSASVMSVQEVDLTSIDKDKDIEITQELRAVHSKSRSPSPHRLDFRKPQNLQLSAVAGSANPMGDVNRSTEDMPGDGRRKLWSRSSSKTALHSPSGSSTKSFEMQIANWRMESICQQSDSSSDDEFFDAEDEASPVLMTKWSSLEMINCADQGTPESIEPTEDEEGIFGEHFSERLPSNRLASVSAMDSVEGPCPDSPTASSPAHHRHHSNSFPSNHPGYMHAGSCPTSVLILVFHAGSVLDEGSEMATSKKSDITTFRGAFESVIRQHYPSLSGRIAIKLVPAPRICSDALSILSSLSPYSFQASPSAIDGVYRTHDAVPLGALPLFAISTPDYHDYVNRVIGAANQSYHDFLRSEDGLGFSGQVVVISDSIGSLLAYDALCRTAQYSSRYGSENSIPELDAAQSVPHHQATGPLPPLSPCIRSNPLISISDGSGNEEGSEEGAETVTKSKQPPHVYKKSHSHPQDSLDGAFCDALSYSRLLSAPAYRRRSSCSSDMTGPHKLDFDVSDFFTFGSPLGTILAYRKMLFFEDKKDTPPRPLCGQMYNLFHPSDPSASRIEPLLHSRFSHLPPVTVPRYHKYPLGDGQPINLMEYIHVHAHVFVEGAALPTSACTMGRRTSEASITSTMSGIAEGLPFGLVSAITQKWWGTKRLDYALFCPEGLASFPANSLPHLFHASYWESTDVIAFVLRQMTRADNLLTSEDGEKEPPVFIPSQPREKWLRKRTSVKIKNVTANHRANDVIAKEGLPQVIVARFMYGPLDMVALSGEKVDVHIMCDQRSGEWTHFSTEVTDKSGRLSYTIPKEKALGFGMFPIKMVVRGDHTCIDFFMAVVPPKTECVVFSIDGSFTASVSVTGKDPKVRAGAVDVVRHWQELGYLIIYITGRPDMQQQRVVAWLAQHNFPHGLVSFAEGFSTDPLKHKADYLKHLQQDVEMVIYAAYGSSKDIWVYTAIGIPPERIFTVGKASKKQHGLATVLSEGYAAHLSDLKSLGRCRPAQGNARMVIPRGCFSLPGQVGAGALRQRRSAKRTTSYPLSSGQQSSQDKGKGPLPKPPTPSKSVN